MIVVAFALFCNSFCFFCFLFCFVCLHLRGDASGRRQCWGCHGRQLSGIVRSNVIVLHSLHALREEADEETDAAPKPATTAEDHEEGHEEQAGQLSEIGLIDQSSLPNVLTSLPTYLGRLNVQPTNFPAELQRTGWLNSPSPLSHILGMSYPVFM